MLTQNEALRLLRYDEETGKCYWRVTFGGQSKAGALAGVFTAVGIWTVGGLGRSSIRIGNVTGGGVHGYCGLRSGFNHFWEVSRET